jgi:hypothetical protein
MVETCIGATAGMLAALNPGTALTPRQAAALTPGMAAGLDVTTSGIYQQALAAEAAISVGPLSITPGDPAALPPAAYPNLQFYQVTEKQSLDITGFNTMPPWSTLFSLSITNSTFDRTNGHLTALPQLGIVGNVMGSPIFNTINFAGSVLLDDEVAVVVGMGLLCYEDGGYPYFNASSMASFANAGSSAGVGGATCNAPPTGRPGQAGTWTPDGAGEQTVVNSFLVYDQDFDWYYVFDGDCTSTGNGSFVVGHVFDWGETSGNGADWEGRTVQSAVYYPSDYSGAYPSDYPAGTSFAGKTVVSIPRGCGPSTACCTTSLAGATSGLGAIGQIIAAAVSGLAITWSNCSLSGLAGVAIAEDGMVTSDYVIGADCGNTPSSTSGTVGLYYAWQLTSAATVSLLSGQITTLLAAMNAVGDGSGSNGQTGTVIWMSAANFAAHGTTWTTGGTPSAGAVVFVLVGGDS